MFLEQVLLYARGLKSNEMTLASMLECVHRLALASEILYRRCELTPNFKDF